MKVNGKILFIRSFTPGYDGKLKKYVTALEKADINFWFLGWERSGKEYEGNYDDRSSFCRRRAPIGGGLRNIGNLIYWNFYVFFWILKNGRGFKVLHAIDFDSSIPAWLISLIFRKKLVVDIYDKYTSARSMRSWLAKLIDSMEKQLIERADLSILADSSRFEQHQITERNNIIIVENVPFYEKTRSRAHNNSAKIITLGYFGGLEADNRGLEDLSKAVLGSENFILHVIGYGELEDFFKKLSLENPDKIVFYGAMNSSEGLEIMRHMDIYVGLYYKTVPNHLYAAPNKYYEHLLMGIPILTTSGTPPGDKVEQYDTGWAIEEGEQCIKSALNKMTRMDISRKGQNAYYLWDERYSNYFIEHYFNEYAMDIAKLVGN